MKLSSSSCLAIQPASGPGGVPPPPPLRSGDHVGIAALSGPVDPARLQDGLESLRGLGWQPVVARNLSARRGLFAGSDEERLAAFHELAARPELKAIFFARGGWGALRVLPDIDWPLLARHPRAYIGYSDLTPFLHQVVVRLGFAAFHGPMVPADLARGLEPREASSLTAALGGRFPLEYHLHPGDGEACEGPLYGGCLSLLVATLATPYAPDLEGALVFFEEIGEPLYRFDRMLTHLRLSGNLAGIRGLIAGHLTRVGEEIRPKLGTTEGETAATGADLPVCSAESCLEDLAAHFAWPYLDGLASGHESPNLTIPVGIWARLDPKGGLLSIHSGTKRESSEGG